MTSEVTAFHTTHLASELDWIRNGDECVWVTCVSTNIFPTSSTRNVEPIITCDTSVTEAFTENFTTSTTTILSLEWHSEKKVAVCDVQRVFWLLIMCCTNYCPLNTCKLSHRKYKHLLEII